MEVLEAPCGITETETATAFFEHYYKSGLKDTARFVSRKGGSYDDAKDILHDALIILYERTKSDAGIDDRYRYLMGIVKNLWFKRMKDNLSTTDLQEFENDIGIPVPTVSEQKLISVLEHAGRKCMDLLTAFYFSGETIATIKRSFNFSSEHSASVQKYKCIEKLKVTIKEKSLGYEDFVD